MLSKTHKNTPARLAAGLIGTGALGLAALGLTASGTQAAEQIKAKVETVTGVKLDQDVPAPPAPPVAAEPVAPRAPAAAPEAPEAPVKARRYVYSYSDDGDGKDKKDGKRLTKIVMVHADGSSSETKLPDLDALRASVPEVRNGKCSDTADGKPVVEKFERDGKKVMIVCSNRIERITINAERAAIDAKRMGMRSAMMGLRMARRSIESQSDLSAEQRAKALKGIDEAIAEVEKSAADDK